MGYRYRLNIGDYLNKDNNIGYTSHIITCYNQKDFKMHSKEWCNIWGSPDEAAKTTGPAVVVS